MLLELSQHYAVSLNRVPIIGDSLRDLQAAAAAGGRPVLVLTGNGQRTAQALPAELGDVETFDNLAAVAAALLAE
jgi:D-glycero-D-manno-heptose 1,7-bisphosphate phosphatase